MPKGVFIDLGTCVRCAKRKATLVFGRAFPGRDVALRVCEPCAAELMLLAGTDALQPQHSSRIH